MPRSVRNKKDGITVLLKKFKISQKKKYAYKEWRIINAMQTYYVLRKAVSRRKNSQSSWKKNKRVDSILTDKLDLDTQRGEDYIKRLERMHRNKNLR